MCYLEGGNKGSIMAKSVYSCESWIVAASNQPQTHWVIFLYDNSFGPLFEFSEMNILLATYWEVITQFSSTELG